MARDIASVDKRRIQDEEGTVIDFDDTTGAISSTTFGLHKLHEGHAFCAHTYDTDLDSAAAITIAFTTPDTIN